MDIDDVGDDPIGLAKEILRQIGTPYGATPLKEIAYAIDIEEIRESDSISVEGALIAPEGKASGSILLSTSKDERRTRFTLAHELGHYVHPLHNGNGNDDGFFMCSGKDMSTYFSKEMNHEDYIEFQANQFAAELILPTTHVAPYLNDISKITTTSIVNLSDDFLTSREATFRRISEKNKMPVAVFYIKDGEIRYFTKSNTFPFPSVWKGHAVPINSLTAQVSLPNNTSSEISSVNTSVWLSRKSNASLLEQTFKQENGYQITLLKLS